MPAALASMSTSSLSADTVGSVSSAGVKACPFRPLQCRWPIATCLKPCSGLGGSRHRAASQKAGLSTHAAPAYAAIEGSLQDLPVCLWYEQLDQLRAGAPAGRVLPCLYMLISLKTCHLTCLAGTPLHMSGQISLGASCSEPKKWIAGAHPSCLRRKRLLPTSECPPITMHNVRWGRGLHMITCQQGAPVDVLGEARPESVPGDFLLAAKAAPPEHAHLRLPDQAVRPLMVVGLCPFCLLRQLLRQICVWPLQPDTTSQSAPARICELSMLPFEAGWVMQAGCCSLPRPAPAFCQVHVCRAEPGSRFN